MLRRSAITADGKIVIVGPDFNGGSYVARLNSDGSIDVTFHGDGITTVQLPSSNVYAVDVEILNDGKIVVAGNVYNGNFTYFAIFRYTSTGPLDSTFGGGDGIATAFEGSGQVYLYSLAIQPNGSIVTAGEFSIGENRSFVVVRHNPDGTIDSGFGTNGAAVIGFSGPSFGQAAAVQTDGKILLAGWNYTNNIGQFALARLNANGSIDPTFGSNGLVVTAFDHGASIDDTAITPTAESSQSAPDMVNSRVTFSMSLGTCRMGRSTRHLTATASSKLQQAVNRMTMQYAVAELPGGRYLSDRQFKRKVSQSRDITPTVRSTRALTATGGC